MRVKCKQCGDTVEVTRPREYKTCKCGAIGLDYGDGDYYYRVCGNPENFDGEIEGAPKVRAQEPRPVDRSLEDVATYLGSLSTALAESADLVKEIAKLINERSKK